MTIAEKAERLPVGRPERKSSTLGPSTFFAASSPRNCTQIEPRSFCVRAQNAIAVPSELITGGPEKSPVKSKLVCAGGGKKERMVRAGSRLAKSEPHE